MKESPLFAKSYDFIRWLIPQTVKFPRTQRFVVTERYWTRAALNMPAACWKKLGACWVDGVNPLL
ncbi:hypothetical protein J9253_03875 [Thiothrix litoralis]|jgi:hypothetical protein|uniref:Uncharacterized protein n=1 Tax=Thiothrix litoralis TaxID=2891210 RepID=A0ABX7WUU8_9GAMM|nr:hypothetical protein [Thiothrix litoralis]QTR47091.1 hypothetical protein J9253_03875 [Thiothrix litoralis]